LSIHQYKFIRYYSSTLSNVQSRQVCSRLLGFPVPKFVTDILKDLYSHYILNLY